MLAGELLAMRAQYNMSHSAAEAVWEWAISRNKEFGKIEMCAKSYRSARRLADSRGPRVKITCIHKRMSDGELVHYTGDEFPRKRFQDRRLWEKVMEAARTSVREIKLLHCSRHKVG